MALFWKKDKTPAAPSAAPIEAPVPMPALVEDAPAVAPAKPAANRRRCEEMKFRISPEEKDELQALAAAAGMTRTDYILASVRRSPVIVVPGVPDLLKELRAEGRNLNQAVKLANERHDTRNLQELQEAIARCTAAQQAVIDFCNTWDAKIRKLPEEDL